MTISKKHVEGIHFALLPRKCDKCNRWFLFEKYTMCLESFGWIGPVEFYYCQHCRALRKEDEVIKDG